jgi:heterotetrameric sarcosine oxidase delta subunit
MLIPCPLCGPRDRREFYYYGASDYLNRPAADAPPEAWDNLLHLRDNPAGETRDLWFHEMGCSAWIEVTRNTVTHQVLASRLVVHRGPSGGSISAKMKTQAPARRRYPRQPKGGAA